MYGPLKEPLLRANPRRALEHNGRAGSRVIGAGLGNIGNPWVGHGAFASARTTACTYYQPPQVPETL